MIIDATFWVAVSFFIFFGVLIYLKVPQKINNALILCAGYGKRLNAPKLIFNIANKRRKDIKP